MFTNPMMLRYAMLCSIFRFFLPPFHTEKHVFCIAENTEKHVYSIRRIAQNTEKQAYSIRRIAQNTDQKRVFYKTDRPEHGKIRPQSPKSLKTCVFFNVWLVGGPFLDLVRKGSPISKTMEKQNVFESHLARKPQKWSKWASRIILRAIWPADTRNAQNDAPEVS